MKKTRTYKRSCSKNFNRVKSLVAERELQKEETNNKFDIPRP